MESSCNLHLGMPENIPSKSTETSLSSSPAVPPLVAKASSPFIMVPTEGANIRATTKERRHLV